MLTVFFLEASFYFHKQNGKVINILGKQQFIIFLSYCFIFFSEVEIDMEAS